MPFRDDTWLSLTPEPERLLPEARAVLRSGQAPPPPALVAAERAAAERLVLSGRRARWDAWLRDSEALAAHASPHDLTADSSRPPIPDSSRPPVAATAALVRDVVANHDALALGLPGERRRWR